MPTCTLSIRNVKHEASIGFHKHEVIKKQPIVLDVSIQLVSHYLGQVNDAELSTSYDYDLAYSAIKYAVAENHYNLLETLGHKIAQRIGHGDSRIRAIKVLIKKPDAYDNGYSECEIVLGEWHGTN